MAEVTRLAIVGGRHFADTKLFEDEVRAFMKANPGTTTIVSGGATGADKMAKQFAISSGLEYVEYAADWNKHGRGAGPIRNKLIVENSDAMIAFWDGISENTCIADGEIRRDYSCKIVKYFKK